MHLGDEVRLAGGGGEGRDQVFVGADVVDDRAGLDHAGPADAASARGSRLPSWSPSRRWNGVVPPSGQVMHFGAVVGGVDDDGVVGDAEVVELLEQLADMAVVLDHAVGIDAQARLALDSRS